MIRGAEIVSNSCVILIGFRLGGVPHAEVGVSSRMIVLCL